MFLRNVEYKSAFEQHCHEDLRTSNRLTASVGFWSPYVTLCLVNGWFRALDQNVTKHFYLNINQLDALNFYNKFISSLYMFRAHVFIVRRAKIVLYSLWYHHTCRWPSGAQVERGLSQPVHGTATYRVM